MDDAEVGPKQLLIHRHSLNNGKSDLKESHTKAIEDGLLYNFYTKVLFRSSIATSNMGDSAALI